MKKLFLVILLFIFSAPAFAASDKESVYERVMRTGTLKCGYYPWPPFFEVDANTGEISGMMAELAESVGELLDLKIEYVQLSALGFQVEELKRGIYDAFCVDSYYVFSSIKFVDYSDPYFYAPVYAYVRSDEDRFKSIKDMNDLSVSFVGIDGDLSVSMVQRSFPNAKLMSIPSNSDGAQIMMNIMTKKADVAIIDPGIVDVFNKTNSPGLKNIFPQDPVAVYPIGFSVIKGESKLLYMLNGAISALHNTNSIEPVLRKYDPDGMALYNVAKPYAQ